MDELKKINAKVARKQIGRLVIGVVSVIGGVVLFSRYSYQKGITDCQKSICNEFPEEYAAMTEKIIQEFEK